MKTVVVNLFSGPGAGKSTFQAGLYWELKWKGVNVEMAMEYAKDIVYEESTKKLDNQIYVFGKQHHRMNRINGKVDVLIADAPLILSAIYDKTNNKGFHKLILKEMSRMDNLNIYIERNDKLYDKRGRVQGTVEEAKVVDTRVKDFLNKHGVEYRTIYSKKTSLKNLVKIVMDELKATGWKKTNIKEANKNEHKDLRRVSGKKGRGPARPAKQNEGRKRASARRRS